MPTVYARKRGIDLSEYITHADKYFNASYFFSFPPPSDRVSLRTDCPSLARHFLFLREFRASFDGVDLSEVPAGAVLRMLYANMDDEVEGAKEDFYATFLPRLVSPFPGCENGSIKSFFIISDAVFLSYTAAPCGRRRRSPAPPPSPSQSWWKS